MRRVRQGSRPAAVLFDCLPLHFLLATFAGQGQRQQARAIDYLVEENRVLREHLGEKRFRLAGE
ncbi:MAG: hypothetical protein FJ265_04875 [Planctomycetes bacterium]|nr:hypothetical protein [Planctomycetota bacterium]